MMPMCNNGDADDDGGGKRINVPRRIKKSSTEPKQYGQKYMDCKVASFASFKRYLVLIAVAHMTCYQYFNYVQDFNGAWCFEKQPP